MRSPEVAADRRVTFRLAAPKASEVVLTGEFMTGSKAFQKDEKGLWTLTVGPMEPEIYNYNFAIDGVRTIDPANPNVKSGSTPSTIQSILTVRGDSPSFYDGASVPHGEIRTHWYPSKSLGSLRRLTVYTPPGYDANAQAPLSGALSVPWRQCRRDSLDTPRDGQLDLGQSARGRQGQAVPGSYAFRLRCPSWNDRR